MDAVISDVGAAHLGGEQRAHEANVALNQKEVEAMVGDLETRLERLRQLYDQYFLGYEKLEPQVPRKDVERRVETLRREQIRNTALRFRFTVLTQKLNTYQSLWQRNCRQIEDGTFKRHVQKAQKRFGAAAGRKGASADLELDIDVDLGDLEAEVERDLEAINDEDRRLLRAVEAEVSGNMPTDTERPTRKDDDDLPTNRPPASENMMQVAIPKSPAVPSMDARSHTAAPFGNQRPAIRKTDPGSPRATARPTRNTPPPFNPNAPVMPKVQSAPPPPPHPAPAPHPGSQSKIALPIPGRASASMRIASAAAAADGASGASGTSGGAARTSDGAIRAATGDGADRRPVTAPLDRSSASMRAALPPGTSMRMPPPGVQSRLAPPGTRTSPGPISTSSMRAAAPVNGPPPGAPPNNPSIRLPPPGATARGSLPMPGTSLRAGDPNVRTGDVPIRRTTDVTSPPKATGEVPNQIVPGQMRPKAPSMAGGSNSRPPPPLPSSIAQRGKQPSLSELADAQKSDKDKK